MTKLAREIIEAPSAFDGTLEQFFQDWASRVLLDLSVIEEFHRQFCAYYLEAEDPLFLIRQVRDLERGQILRTETGSQFRPTDNAPAWWIHYQLFTGQVCKFPSFDTLVKSIPSHLFEVRSPGNVSQAGWHVAHIFDAKDGNVDFKKWGRSELVRRTARSIPPCNYFYISKVEWQLYGGNPHVISFFYQKFRTLYAPVWNEFLELVEGDLPQIATGTNDLPYYFPVVNNSQRPENMKNVSHAPFMKDENQDTVINDCVVTYEFSRLCFKADVIEPLMPDDRFCIVTPEGIFSMTKREFYETFANVVQSQSYQQRRIYHYPTTPQRAIQFKNTAKKI